MGHISPQRSAEMKIMKPTSYLIMVFLTASAWAGDSGLNLLYPVYPPRPVHEDKADLSAEVEQALLKRDSATSSKKDLKEMKPEEIFLNAFEKTQDAQAIKTTDSQRATSLLADALSDLIGLKKQFPDWQPEVINYRIKKLQALIQ